MSRRGKRRFSEKVGKTVFWPPEKKGVGLKTRETEGMEKLKCQLPAWWKGGGANIGRIGEDLRPRRGNHGPRYREG